MIVDAHVHIFPPLAGAPGFATEEEHRRVLQLYIGTHGEPVRRLRDHALAPGADGVLQDGLLDGPASLNEAANFRVGGFGRFEWDLDGETYYRSFFAPGMDELVCPPEMIVQAMARAGIDCAILQNARLYGRLNEHFAEAVRRFPGRFIGLADVKEDQAETPGEIARLTHAVRELGLRGLYYANRGLFVEGYRDGFDDRRFDPFWQTVRALGIPVFWEILGVPLPTEAAYLDEIDRLNRWCARYPDVPGVLTHGIGPEFLTGNVPEPIVELCRREQILIEVLYPIHWGREHEYPYGELRPVLRRLVDLVGSERLVWGSDMPNVERNCTYRQSLEYLRYGLDGVVTAREMDGIWGGNVMRALRSENRPVV